MKKRPSTAAAGSQRPPPPISARAAAGGGGGGGAAPAWLHAMGAAAPRPCSVFTKPTADPRPTHVTHLTGPHRPPQGQ
jgi:hypothetical protein